MKKLFEDKELLNMDKAAVEELKGRFDEIDAVAFENTAKVLGAFQKYRDRKSVV